MGNFDFIKTSIWMWKLVYWGMEALSGKGPQSYISCKHPNFSAVPSKDMTSKFMTIFYDSFYSKQVYHSKPHILSCLSFEMQMPDNLEITSEEENVIWCIFSCQTESMTKPLCISWLEEAVSRIIPYLSVK